jgi:hypothetical protein
MDHANHYFPDPQDVAAHANAFVQLMFANAAYEAEIRLIQNAITKDHSFGEKPANDWKTRERPKLIAKLLKKHLPQFLKAAQLENLLTDVILPSDQRNILVHGEWWRFNKQTSVITVRSGKRRPGEEQHHEFKAADIEKLVETFKTAKVELYKIRRQIENS